GGLRVVYESCSQRSNELGAGGVALGRVGRERDRKDGIEIARKRRIGRGYATFACDRQLSGEELETDHRERVKIVGTRTRADVRTACGRDPEVDDGDLVTGVEQQICRPD